MASCEQSSPAVACFADRQPVAGADRAAPFVSVNFASLIACLSLRRLSSPLSIPRMRGIAVISPLKMHCSDCVSHRELEQCTCSVNTKMLNPSSFSYLHQLAVCRKYVFQRHNVNDIFSHIERMRQPFPKRRIRRIAQNPVYGFRPFKEVSTFAQFAPKRALRHVPPKCPVTATRIKDFPCWLEPINAVLRAPIRREYYIVGKSYSFKESCLHRHR
jgi:hypothetical protein